ncbi:hypothetical protein SAMN05216553_113174 [Lentzea fradiae]|uniref:Uncharacterized protein n=1 Tax=Lentzea fradiae TaxID=200378 RepID=A0A1G7Y9S8_9PSEU|nr:hypothetical protein [Lentzea fradiae]SDG93211.1 hypothetical protein SAMN05216553_113174 [Lentzea fradiae]
MPKRTSAARGREFGASAFAGMTSLTLLSFREDEFEDVVYLDSLHGGTWLEAECERRRTRRRSSGW